MHVHVHTDSYVAGSASVSYQYCISCRCDCPITLLRIYCIMFSNLSVFFYPSTSSSVVNVCDGANVTLTYACITDTGTLIWSTATGHKTFKSGFMENSSTVALGDCFIVQLTNMQNMTLMSELTIVAPPPSLHKSIILCRDDGYPVSFFIEKTLLISCI